MNRDTVEKVAELARLQLTEQEIVRFQADLTQVLHYVDKLSTVPTTGVAPMVHPFTQETVSGETLLREDMLEPSLGAEELLKSSPDSLFDSYKVPQVIGG